ncbi:alpha/beta fold hydrolase [uncultured Tateyamaria sp.]|uniref:alpha/beta hydrolase n=1 Tax=uncultured Tateyamaria sp. TaxID=455651 RepID=UPI002617F77C|nr:alpha/beta fold hydrolase [uncultured Tateyamaria sp.]
MPAKVLFSAVLSVFVFSVPDDAAAQHQPGSVGRIVEIKVPAPALDSNLLDTPTIQDAAVYLPPGYDGQADRRFPVLYLLHGIFDDYGVWTEHFDVPSVLDRLIAEQVIPEMIVVMPNAGNRYGGGYYRNSAVSGNWADYIADDLVGYVDASWRTLPSDGSRAVVGHSMGGYGALNLAMNRPDVFSVVWAQSPCCLSPRDDLGFGNDAWKRAAAVKGPEDIQSLINSRDFYPVAFLGVVTAFSADPNAGPIYGNFPFDVVRGEIVLDDAAFDLYADRFPIRQVGHARDALRGLRGLGVGVGLDDQFLHIPAGALEFSHRLGTERIPHRLDVYDGDHREFVAERLEEIVFPWVAERLVVDE